MENISGAASVEAGISEAQPTNYVTYPQNNELGTGFAEVMDNVRGRADAMDTMASDLQKKGASGSPGDRQVAQLVDLYSYAVDTQLLVRTGSQLTTGVRQLMSGQ